MIRKLRWKFVLINMALVTVMLAAICLFFVSATRESLKSDSESVLQRVISETETPSWSFYGGGSAPVSLPYFTVVVRPNGGAYITSSQFYDLDNPDTILAAVNAAFDQQASQGMLEEYHLRYLREATADGWRMAFVDVSYERSTLRQATWNTLQMGLIAFVLFFGASMVLARWAVRPVAQSWEQQRQFVADASHELKTPLTVILSNADLLAEQEEAEPDKRRRWAENIQAGGRQMGTLVEQLLLLARSDSGQAAASSFQPVDLTELVQSAALMFEPVAFEAGKSLELTDTEDSVTVSGDGGKLKRLLDILLDNAAKYADPGGQITLSLRREGRRAVIAVTDQGAPIPREELEAIFRRFYRADRARSTQGFGLGLAIARSIAQEHRGKLWAQSDPAGYNTFFCSLPLA